MRVHVLRDHHWASPIVRQEAVLDLDASLGVVELEPLVEMLDDLYLFADCLDHLHCHLFIVCEVVELLQLVAHLAASDTFVVHKAI